MNERRLAYWTALSAVIAMAVLISSALAQVPDDLVDAIDDSDQSQELGGSRDSPIGLPPPSDWGPPYFANGAPLYLRVEYLNWWLNGNSLPSLVTTSPVGTDPILGMAGTQLLFGGDEVDSGGRGGFRATLGARLAHWLDTDLKLEAHLIVLGGERRDSGDFFVTSMQSPILGRPFFNVQAGVQDAVAVAAPGLLFPDPVTGLPDPTLVLDSAELQIASTSALNAAGVVVRKTWMEDDSHWIDLLAGYRYLRFQERLGIRQSQSFSDPTDPNRASTIDIQDEFSTWSQFHGGEIGVVTSLERGPLGLELLAKVAFGNVREKLEITGERVITRPDAPRIVEASSGVLAVPSNIGRYATDRFNVVPEIGITLRHSITRSSAVTVGYTLIAFPQALRTGDQIDTVIDPTQTTARPRALLNDSTIWIHGINIGLEW